MNERRLIMAVSAVLVAILVVGVLSLTVWDMEWLAETMFLTVGTVVLVVALLFCAVGMAAGQAEMSGQKYEYEQWQIGHSDDY